MNNNSTLATNRLKHARTILHAIKHDLRLEILVYLSEHPNSIVKDIYKSLDIEQSVVSQHLGILRNASLVIDNRIGQRVQYSVNYKKLEQINNSLDKFVD